MGDAVAEVDLDTSAMLICARTAFRLGGGKLEKGINLNSFFVCDVKSAVLSLCAMFPESRVQSISCRRSRALPGSICAFHVCYAEGRGSEPAASAQGSALPASGSASAAAVSGEEIPPHAAQGPNPAPVAAARPQTQRERAAEAERKVRGSCPEANS